MNQMCHKSLSIYLSIYLSGLLKLASMYGIGLNVWNRPQCTESASMYSSDSASMYSYTLRPILYIEADPGQGVQSLGHCRTSTGQSHWFHSRSHSLAWSPIGLNVHLGPLTHLSRPVWFHGRSHSLARSPISLNVQNRPQCMESASMHGSASMYEIGLNVQIGLNVWNRPQCTAVWLAQTDHMTK